MDSILLRCPALDSGNTPFRYGTLLLIFPILLLDPFLRPSPAGSVEPKRSGPGICSGSAGCPVVHTLAFACPKRF